MGPPSGSREGHRRSAPRRLPSAGRMSQGAPRATASRANLHHRDARTVGTHYWYVARSSDTAASRRSQQCAHPAFTPAAPPDAVAPATSEANISSHSANSDRFLRTLQQLLAIPGADLESALTHATDALTQALEADKVDAFLYDEARDSLVAVGASTQPLSALQRRLGLDVIAVSNGGRSAMVYQTGERYHSGRVHEDMQ